MTRLRRPAIYLVTDRRQLTPDARTLADELAALDRFIDEAIAAGVDAIQIRERDVDAAALVRLAARALRQAEGTGTLVLVNDRMDVALAAGAGLHVRGDGPALARVRDIAPRATIGLSIHRGDRIDVEAGADYLLFGTVFRSVSKPPEQSVTGLAALHEAVVRFTVPIIAIGGLTPANAQEAIRAGAAGVAAIGVFLPPGRTPAAMGLVRAVAAFRSAMADREQARRP